jgi:hypothetical protein
MARIPDGSQFGQVVARGGPMANVDAGAFGAGVADAVTRIGGAGMQIAQDQNNQAIAEAKQKQREQEAEAKAAAKEAARVKALTATATVQSGLSGLHDQIQADLESGKIDKSQIESTWTDQSKKILDTSMATVDAEHKDLVNASLLNDMGRYGQSVKKLAIARDKQDIMVGGLSYIEQMQRFAARGAKEADQAIANVQQFWTATGPMAGENPAQTAARVQKFTENVRSRQATELVNTNPAAALRQLKDSNFLPELDPDKRTALIQSADASVLRTQQRGALQAEAAARAQTKAWEGAQSVFQAGKMPTPEYAAELAKSFKGTPYEAALKSMMADGPANSAFVVQPVAQQSASLTAMQNKMNQGGATPEDLKAYERMDRAHKATLADIQEDPYKAASERGVLIDLQPLSLDLKTLPSQLSGRAQQANIVSQWTGKEVSLFRPDEADKVANVLQAMPPKDRAGALAGLTAAMNPGQRVAFAKQVAPKDRALELAAGISGDKTTAGRYTSELLLLGQQAVKDKGVKPDSAAVTGTKARAAEYLGNSLTGKARDDVLDAAVMIYNGMQAEGSGADPERAVRLALGGPVVEYNGKKMPAPAQFNQENFGAAVQKTAADTVGSNPVYVSGREVAPEAFLKALPSTDLQAVGQGRYVVRSGSGLVTDKAGKALVLEVR